MSDPESEQSPTSSRPTEIQELAEQVSFVHEHVRIGAGADVTASMVVRDEDHEIETETGRFAGPGVFAITRTDGDDPERELSDLEEHVEAVHDHVEISRGSGQRVSLLVRGPEGEIDQEGHQHPLPGVFALTMVTRAVEDLDEYGFNDRQKQDPPEWHEWVHCEPPIGHMVDGQRCTDCDEEGSVFRGIPESKGPSTWERLRHRGDCEHASERDKEVWEQRQKAKKIRKRPDPQKMAISCICREASSLHERLEDTPPSDALEDAIYSRFASMKRVLLDRMDARYTECPHCGASLTQEEPGVYTCANWCEDWDAETEMAVSDDRLRVWGIQGHGEPAGSLGEGDVRW